MKVSLKTGLRDIMAMRAMQGILANQHSNPTEQHHYDNIAEDSYRMADTMIKERKKQ